MGVVSFCFAFHVYRWSPEQDVPVGAVGTKRGRSRRFHDNVGLDVASRGKVGFSGLFEGPGFPAPDHGFFRTLTPCGWKRVFEVARGVKAQMNREKTSCRIGE